MMNIPFPAPTALASGERLFSLRNGADMTVTISERGAALRAWRAPDRYGRMANVLLADAPAAAGFHPAPWQGRQADDGVSLLLVTASQAGAALDMMVNYRLDDDGSLTIDYSAIASRPTPLRVRAQPYFNLNGGVADVGDHMLQIDADSYLALDDGGAPLALAAVGGTPFDFRQPAAIGPRLRWPDRQTRQAGGFDHCYVARSDGAAPDALREVAQVVDPGSGRRLQVFTTGAALQFCSGAARDGAPRAPFAGPDGFCLEPSAPPGQADGAWPMVCVRPGRVYRQTTVYRLSLQS